MELPWCSGRWLDRPRLHALQRHEKVGSMMVCLTIHGGTIALFEGRAPVSEILRKRDLSPSCQTIAPNIC